MSEDKNLLHWVRTTCKIVSWFNIYDISNPNTQTTKDMDKATTDCLQQQLACHTYGEQQLKQCIQDISRVYIGDICNCTACLLCNRMRYVPDRNGYEGLKHCDDCILKKYLIHQAKKIGFQVQQCSDEEFNDTVTHLQFYTCHLCIVTYDGNWVPVYGSMLSDNALHLNPDLWMLKELFDICQSNEFFWE
jgi:hypothetical protein